MRLDARIETWPFKEPIVITGYTFTGFDYLVVTLEDGDLAGRGEATGIYYRHDTPAGALDELDRLRAPIESGVGRDELPRLLSSRCARNALDAALWELESLRTGVPVWRLAGLDAPPRPLRTTFTLNAEAPDKIVQTAQTSYAQASALKLKLNGQPEDADRVRAVRAARPDCWIGVDANQGFSRESLERLMPVLVDADVKLIEQPLPVGQEDGLDGLASPIPLAADESVQGVEDIAALVGHFDVVNIKLDKCGGLTEALAMVHEARRLGLQVMVGNMTGTTLAMAPAFVVAQACDYVDLDGPLALRGDRKIAVDYTGGKIFCPADAWGAPGQM